jgi:ribosomal protein S18 acetylase RimI-like enzyme
MVEIVEPATLEELEEYYTLRWQVLRRPWDKPKGSEKDEFESESYHAMARSDSGEILGVIRLQHLANGEGQIRYMGVTEKARGMKIGSRLIDFIEQKAINEGMQTIILHSRETAVDFYRSKKYELIEKSYLMWNEIQHYLMKKRLI